MQTKELVKIWPTKLCGLSKTILGRFVFDSPHNFVGQIFTNFFVCINQNHLIMAINHCAGDWVFLIDADERVSKDLADEIMRTVKNKSSQNGFFVNRRNWFLGGFLTKGGAYPDSVIRLFKKGKGKLPELTVHE